MGSPTQGGTEMNEDEFREIMVDFDELILNDLTNNQVRDLYAVANNVFLDAQEEMRKRNIV